MSAHDLMRLTHDATVWYDPATKAWWMAGRHARANMMRVLAAPRAISVTNAYYALPLKTIEKLAEKRPVG